ncbi:MAG TPA: Rieske 2Fe-2S domain-containing protein, partial [Acidiphilium sp.]
MAEPSSQDGPDFTAGFPLTEIPDGGMVSGHVGGEPALLARHGGEVFAIGATCTHYGAPLADGLVVGGTIRCPWHHACFSLRTGEVLRAPALSGVRCWRVEQRDGRAIAREAVAPAQPEASGAKHPESVVIVGGGAAGHSAAITLRREGYRGAVTILGADPAPPCD